MNTYEPSPTDTALLVPENPFGYGTVGSISAGELFLVKKRGGGVLVIGDIDAPSSVTYLPGVQPVGNFFGKGESCQLGFVYCSQGFGAWVWNGSNVSQKISNQLEDNFYDCTTDINMPSTNYGFFVKRWGDWLLFSNNYVFSMVTNSWWKLNVPVTMYHYTDAMDQHQLYCLPLSIGPSQENFLYTLDTRVGCPEFEWTSTELFSHVSKTNERVVDIREVMIKASCPNTGGTVTMDIQSNGATIATSTSTDAIGEEPTLIRFNFGVLGLNNFKILLVSQSSEVGIGSSLPAPTIWSIDIAYRTRAKVASDN
jgi:hypothetical protein